MGLGLLLLAVGGGAYYLARGGAPPAPPAPPAMRRDAAPLPAKHAEAMASFVKTEACEATACDRVVCQTFSDGKTKDWISRIVTCRWLDKREPAETRRCAYVHYMYNPEGTTFGEMFLSAPARGDACQPDRDFTDIIKRQLGYTGEMP